jgi:hypothetical protein
MKKALPFLVFLFCTLNVNAEKVADFPKIMRPTKIYIDGEKMYVVESQLTISAYSISTQKFLREISKNGEGPGEFSFRPELKILPDSIFLGAVNKVMVFSKEGRLIKEKRVIPRGKVLPVKTGYISIGVARAAENIFNTVNLLDVDLNKTKELYRQLRPQRKGGINPIRSYLGIDTFEDKIFIIDGNKDFVIEVFDNKGTELYVIETNVEKIRIPNSYQEMLVNQLKEQPGGNGAEWRGAIERFGVEYPKFFPDIKEFQVLDGKIYVQTYKIEEGKTEYIILDLKGKTLQTAFLPVFEEGSLVDKNVYTFYKNVYYYLKFNDNKEIWELHQIDFMN